MIGRPVMKGERLVIEGQAELLEHLTDEKDITIKFKLAFLKCFSSLGRDLGSLWTRSVQGGHIELICAW